MRDFFPHVWSILRSMGILVFLVTAMTRPDDVPERLAHA